MTFDEVMAVYRGSDGAATRSLYDLLSTFAPRGTVAMNLLRTCKNSERAKGYRSGRSRALAYGTKDWAIGELCAALVLHDLDPSAAPIDWGWGRDEKAIGFEHVLYVEVPGAGQVSFHTEHRRDGHDFAGRWDGARGTAASRICLWTEAVLQGREVVVQTANQGEKNVARDGSQGEAAAGVSGEQSHALQKQETLDL